MTDENKLLHQLLKRKEDALEEAIRIFTPYLSTVIYRAAGSLLTKEDTEEIAADVFLSLWKNAERIDPGKGSLRSPVLGHGRYCRAAAADRGSGVFLPCLGTYSRTVEAVASLCGSGGCFFHLCQVRRRRPHPGRRLHHHRKTPGRIHAGNPPSGGRTDQSMKRSREC